MARDGYRRGTAKRAFAERGTSFYRSQTSTAASSTNARKFLASFSKRIAIRPKRLMRWKKCSTKQRSR